MTDQELTICDAQTYQPWSVPYSDKVKGSHPNLLEMYKHNLLHVIKTMGKIATELERNDHDDKGIDKTIIMSMAADLLTEALRFANLCEMNLALSYIARVNEKNKVCLLTIIEQEKEKVK